MYTFDNKLAGVTCSIAVRKWTLEELLKEKDAVYARKNGAEKRAKELHEELLNIHLTRDELRNKEGHYDHFFEVSREADALHEEATKQGIIIDGINGAIRYHMGCRFNEIIPEVLKKYAGKKCGPKTYEKFRNAVETAMGLEGIHALFQRSHVDFYGGGIGSDCVLYEVTELTDRENCFNSEYSVHIPQDAFGGEYPSNWSEWAALVIDADMCIKDAYAAYISKQDALIKALKIGDVAMSRVHSYDLKEVR